MKKHIVVLLMLIVPLVQVTSAAQNQPTSQELVGSPAEQKPKAALAFGLQEGTPVRLRITRTLSSADAQVGETVDFEVLDEVKASETVIIPRGGIAWATVTEAESKRRLGRGGKLNVNIDTVRLASGEKAALRAVKEVKGASKAGVMTVAIVATSLLFFPAAPLFLLMKGKDITIPKGTEITAYINGDTALDPKKFGSALGAADNTSTVASGAVVAAIDVDHSTVTIKSNLEDAEVFVGGRFVGSTPSTLRLRAGDHVITVKKTGYSEWKRSISLNAGGNITLNALLEKAQ